MDDASRKRTRQGRFMSYWSERYAAAYDAIFRVSKGSKEYVKFLTDFPTKDDLLYTLKQPYVDSSSNNRIYVS